VRSSDFAPGPDDLHSDPAPASAVWLLYDGYIGRPTAAGDGDPEYRAYAEFMTPRIGFDGTAVFLGDELGGGDE